jgi:hypothetical protein
MKEVIILIFFLSQLLYSQTGVVRGLVKNQSTGGPVIGATVVIEGTPFGTTTDRLGWFEIKGVPPGKYNLVVIASSFEIKKVQVSVLSDEISYVDVKVGSEGAGKSFSGRKVEGYFGTSIGVQLSSGRLIMPNIEFGILASGASGSISLLGSLMSNIIGIKTKVFASDMKKSVAFFAIMGLHYVLNEKFFDFGVGVGIPIKSSSFIASFETRTFFDLGRNVPFFGVTMIGLGVRF